MNLAGEDLHVWLLFDQQPVDASRLAQAESILDAGELESAARRGSADLRRQFLLTRLMQRLVLSAYAAGVQPGQWRFETGEHGKPALAREFAALGLHFNLSHTAGLIAMAVARRGPLGVDVERIEARGTSLAIARRHFTPREAFELERLPESSLQRRFYQLWTLKEAWLKAQGVGIGAGLDRVSAEFRADGALAGLRVADENRRRWQLWQASPSPEHLLGLAVRTDTAMSATLLRTRLDAAAEPELLPPPAQLAVDSGQEQRPES